MAVFVPYPKKISNSQEKSQMKQTENKVKSHLTLRGKKWDEKSSPDSPFKGIESGKAFILIIIFAEKSAFRANMTTGITKISRRKRISRNPIMKDGCTRTYSHSHFDTPYVELSSERSDIRWHARV